MVGSSQYLSQLDQANGGVDMTQMNINIIKPKDQSTTINKYMKNNENLLNIEITNFYNVCGDMMEDSDAVQRKTVEIKTILKEFREIYKNRFTSEEVNQIFQNSFDQLFPKSKTTLTEHDVQSLYDHFKVAANKHYIAMIHYDSFLTASNNSIVRLGLNQFIVDPLQNLKNGTLGKIIPFGLREFLVVGTFKQRSQVGSYWYGYYVFEDFPLELAKACQNTSIEAEICLKVMSFQWIQASTLFNQNISASPVFRSKYSMLMLIFGNLDKIQTAVHQESTLKSYLESSDRIGQIGDLKPSSLEILNLIQIVSILSKNYKAYDNPYIRSILYFLASKLQLANGQNELISDQTLPIVFRYHIARRFCPVQIFNTYNEKLNQKLWQTTSTEYLPFITSDDKVKQIIQHQLQQKQEIEKISIISLIMLTKKKKKDSIYEFNTGAPVLQEIIQTYTDYIKMSNSRQIQIKFMKFYQHLVDFHEDNKKDPTTTLPVVYIQCPECTNNFIFLQQLKDQLREARVATKAMKNMSSNRNSIVGTYQCLCGRKNNVCCVCLETIIIYNSSPYVNQVVKHINSENPTSDKLSFQRLCQAFEDSLTFCPKCEHGGHYKHIVQWHQKNPKTCPVFNCKCKCVF